MTDVRPNTVQQTPHTMRLAGDFRVALRRYILRDGLALALFGLVALLTMLPVVPHMRTQVLGGPGDTNLYTYMFGWMAQGIVLGESPFVDPRTNYPDGLVLTATDEPYLWMLLTVPFTLALGPVFSYNLVLLLATFFSGYITYLWIRRVTGSRAGALIAGLIFMLGPSRLSHIFGHVNIVCSFVIPLFFWKLDNVLSLQRPRLRDFVILTVATAVLGATSQYMLTLCLVVGGFYTLFAVLPDLRYLLVQGWRIALSVLVGAAASLTLDLVNADRNLYRQYRLSDIRMWAADPINFLLPWRLHPWWGDAVERFRSEPYWGEKTLYVGVVGIVLTVIAFRFEGSARRRLWVWLGAAIVAAIFALGRDLHINNQPVQQNDPILLPAAYLAQLPFMNVIRVWPRFGIITSFFVACLAGVGTAWLIQRFPRWPVVALVGILVLIDFMPPTLGTSVMEPRPVERWLAQQPGDFAVAFLPPFGPGDDVAAYEALFGTLYHAKQLPVFNHPFHRSRAYNRFSDIAQNFPSDESVEQLRASGYRYLLLERSRFNGKRTADWATVETYIAQHPNLQIITTEGDIVVVGFR